MARFKLNQRRQYQRNYIGRLYWQYRDKKIFQWITGENIIDLGCGEGVTLEKLIKQFPSAKTIGIDNDPLKIKICQKHNLPVKLADLTCLSFKNNYFDCALLIEVIEHLKEKNVLLALKEIYRILKPNGRLIILFPHLKFKEAFANYSHLRQWQPKDAVIFKKSGFTVVRQESLPFIFWPFSLHHLVVLKKML